MFALKGLVVGGLLQLLPPVVPKCVEQPIPHTVTGFLPNQYRLVDQRSNDVQRGLWSRFAGANTFCRIQFETTGEYRESAPHVTFCYRAQGVTPVDAQPQRLLSCGSPTGSCCQHLVAVGESLEDLFSRHHTHSCRRQFDRQWKAVQPLTDLRNCNPVLLGEAEFGHFGDCSLREQRYGVVSGEP